MGCPVNPWIEVFDRPSRRMIINPFIFGVPPFSPSDIAGLDVWLKADSLALSDGDPVATWTDSSGNGNNATQGTSGNRPTLQTNELNALPVVRFDGSDDFLVTSYTPPGTHTLFVVYVRTSGSFVGNTTGDGPLFRNINYWTNVNNSSITLTTSIGSGPNFLAASAGSVHLHGVDITSFGTNNSASGSAISVGVSLDGSYNGDIAELVYYNSVLGTTDRQSVESYLAAKYGL